VGDLLELDGQEDVEEVSEEGGGKLLPNVKEKDLPCAGLSRQELFDYQV
jgi:hypothetical protein